MGKLTSLMSLFLVYFMLQLVINFFFYVFVFVFLIQVITTFLLTGVIFIPVGFVSLHASQNVIILVSYFVT